jgi:signal transduction histidine kinase/ligand-binding sensor domain-containing protein
LPALVFCLTGVIKAERLPVKIYTSADGFAHDTINRIVRDSHGFLWFCTVEGLSRFDGYKFTNYGTDEGLSHRYVYDLIETRGGDYWVATASGICRFNPRGKPANQKGGQPYAEPMFVAYFPDNARARWANDLYEDSAGRIWCATEGGLYQLEQASGQWQFRYVDLAIKVRDQYDDAVIIYTMVEDDGGALWVGSNSGLYIRWPDGRAERFAQHGVTQLLKDSSGRIWVGGWVGLYRIVSGPERPVVECTFTKKDGLRDERINSLLQSSDGSIWVATGGGLSRLTRDGGGGKSFQTYTAANGFPSDRVGELAEDRDRNLWVASSRGGAMKISRNGFVAYTSADGIKSQSIYSLFEDKSGNLCIFGYTNKKIIEWFDGKRFNSFTPNVDPRLTNWNWGSHQNTFQDSAGEWWVATGEGLYRYPKVGVEQLARTRPKAVYTTKNGLPTNEIFKLFEDSRGDIWIGGGGLDYQFKVARWERATETIQVYPPGEGFPRGAVTAIGEDREGNIWVAFYIWAGLYPNGLVRYSKGHAAAFALAEGLPPGQINRIHSDSRGRLWLTTGLSGLVRVDNPSSEHPQFVQYTTAQGLSSNSISDMVEDRWGRLYLVTGRGVDRLDVETGRIRHYTSAEGLPANVIFLAFRHSDGSLWFAYFQGELARLVPEPDPPQQPPPIFVSGLRIAGVGQRLSELGETDIVTGELEANQNQVQIDFFGLSLAPGEALRYQYRLEGSGEDWSEPTELRTVNYPGLPPGTYRFLVQAVSADGTVSDKPAVVSFTILPPVYQRWWFIALVAAAAGAMAYLFYRYRVRRLVELERVRTRIATDLHDDIGASLSRMAILSEVVKRQTATEHKESSAMLTEIAESARGLVDSMSDIVWAIDPRKDDLNSLAQRIRRFASDVLEAQGIQWQFDAPGGIENIKLPPEQRRHLFLIFKEAINNIARHAECRQAWLNISVAHNRLVAEIRDDGRGFSHNSSEQPVASMGGNGLRNIQARAAELGGSLAIDSANGRGTRLKISLPLKGQPARQKAVGD